MTPHLNHLQAGQLRYLVAEHTRDVRAGLADAKHAPVRIAAFPCGVPGMACAQTRDGFTVGLLYPCPRPVPRDPLFQHAESLHVLDHSLAGAMMQLHSHDAMRRDWQAREGAAMDAPETMPAGACEWFAVDEDAFGAQQVTCTREAGGW